MISSDTIMSSALQKKNLLSVYFTAGFPQLEDTNQILLTLQEFGVDMVEIGFPFSDPIADGPLIQKSSQRAIKNGMTLKKLFMQLESINSEIKIPVLLMGYLNPVIQFGIKWFCQKCNQVGISGIIIPDLPLTEFEEKYFKIFSLYDINPVFLVTPTTSEARIRYIDSITSSFIYAVSDSAITGGRNELTEQQLQYLKKLSEMNLKHPVLTGFGISNKGTFQSVCRIVSGGIIGSAFIKELESGNNIRKSISKFIKEIRSNDYKTEKGN